MAEVPTALGRNYSRSPDRGTCVLSPQNDAADRPLGQPQHLLWWSCDSRDSLSPPLPRYLGGIMKFEWECRDKHVLEIHTASVTTTRIQRSMAPLYAKIFQHWSRSSFCKIEPESQQNWNCTKGQAFKSIRFIWMRVQIHKIPGQKHFQYDP